MFHYPFLLHFTCLKSQYCAACVQPPGQLMDVSTLSAYGQNAVPADDSSINLVAGVNVTTYDTLLRSPIGDTVS